MPQETYISGMVTFLKTFSVFMVGCTKSVEDFMEILGKTNMYSAVRMHGSAV